MNKKIIFALFGVFLMTSGIFVLISYIPPSASGNNGNGGTAIPALSNVGETAGTSIGVNYWVQNSVANSGTTNAYLGLTTNDLSGLITTGSSTSYTFGFSLHATPYASIGFGITEVPL